MSSIDGQSCTPGELRVIVIDSQESEIFDALVSVGSGSASLGKKSTTTRGSASFEKVPCGIWEVTVSKEGFQTGAKIAQVKSGANVSVTVALDLSVQTTSVDVVEPPPPVEQSASQDTVLVPAEVKQLPTNPATVDDTLPLVPGVVRTPDGELKINSTGQERSAMVVNQTDITDPATGKFGETIPIDSIETVNVLMTPFLAQYGRFTQSVVAVETRRGGEKWHAELNDPFPDFRVRSFHLMGIRNETPRAVFGGPLIANRLYFISSLQYILDKVPNRTLGYPHNESKQESVNSFTQLDFIISDRQLLTATMHISPQHTNFVNPDYFNPQPVTPSYAQHNYVGTLAHHLGILNGTLDSSVSVQQFDVVIGAQGDAGMILAPQGNQGNFFGTQNRNASRTEWLEAWSLAPLKGLGTHLVKIGSSLTGSSDAGRFTYRSVSIHDASGILTQRIDFTNQNPFNRSDLEVTAFVQDHWLLTPSFSIDYGARIEHQRLASSLRVGPRVGFAWSLFSDHRTVFRAGSGLFYDHLPLDIYTFGRYPLRTITNFNPDGTINGSPIEYINVIGSVTGPRSFFVHGQQVAGAFSPRGVTVNLQLEHKFPKLARVRAVYTDSSSLGLVVFEQETSADTNEVVLNGNGKSRYRQLVVDSKLTWKSDQQLDVAYTRSDAQGNLNTFDLFLGNYPIPIIRPNVYTTLPADLPNRFLVWGHLNPHVWNLSLQPIVEYRNGFPYAKFDAMQNYVGTPNNSRYPNFFSADVRISRDFKVSPKYKVRLSLSIFNMTNHFNALAIHNNIADPSYGVFFGNYDRRYRGDFDILF
ncbi:MAG TPA: hypothetical protein VMT15_11605 [Bryobacteraceae bacterium]|nr:hypothetical protein [Bryobacteraceae bacterium]